MNDTFDYPLPKSSKFPYASIERMSMSDAFLDSASNETTYNFRIHVIDYDTDSSAMESRLDALVDAIGVELRKKTNITLNGDAVSFRIVNNAWGWVQDEQFALRAVFIDVEARQIKTIV